MSERRELDALGVYIDLLLSLGTSVKLLEDAANHHHRSLSRAESE
jgi:hypothetical protein